MMKPFELSYLCLEPLLPPLQRKVRHRLLALANQYGQRPEILDVGGRKSHYTIGVRGNVTITDLPRESELQRQLNLGVTEAIIDENLTRRSNVSCVLYDDMTHSNLRSEAFDCVVAVEVLEHVEEDERFVKEVRRVLKPGGVFFMTTPNGDSVKNDNPDHKRHYRREQLRRLLKARFSEVEIIYAIWGGKFRELGLRSWSLRRPLQTVLSIVGNTINSIQSAPASLRQRPVGTRHIVATARKN